MAVRARGVGKPYVVAAIPTASAARVVAAAPAASAARVVAAVAATAVAQSSRTPDFSRMICQHLAAPS